MEESQPVPTVDSLPLNQPSPSSDGVGNCYVFKSQLQEYAQKVGIPTPVYQTVKEGPSHEPVFRSTVIVNDVKHESLPGFFNRKAAEQSAAEIALMEIYKSGQMTESIPTVHETGLGKNMLQEYAQKMNYAIPLYKCNKQEKGSNPFICTVEIGGIQYIGAAARTKKEAEIKATRTALLAIQYGSQRGAHCALQYTVLPSKKKGTEQKLRPEAVEKLKPMKGSMKKKRLKWKLRRHKGDKSPKYDNEESLTHVDNGEDASMTSSKVENELGSGGMKDELQTQINELKASATEMNGCCQDDTQNRLTTLKAERLEESREGKIVDSAFVQDVKANATVEISSVQCEE